MSAVPLSVTDLDAELAFAFRERILRGLGAPDPARIAADVDRGLVAVHLASIWHRLTVLREVLVFYAARTRLPEAEYPSLASVDALCPRETPPERSMRLYEHAIALSPSLAEAHFGLARLNQLAGRHEEALAGFERTLALPVHPQASPHAHLHANALWERAVIEEAGGNEAAALASYRAALVKLDYFGVHHRRAARLMRKSGAIEEAMEHYGRLMRYSHRYFAEFVLPEIMTPQPAAPALMHTVYETSKGESVIFFEGKYLAVPAGAFDGVRLEDRRIDDALRARSRLAESILALETA